MAYKISEECVGCAACVDTCPVEAIMVSGDKYKIDAEKCTDCGSCIDSCPVQAISS